MSSVSSRLEPSHSARRRKFRLALLPLFLLLGAAAGKSPANKDRATELIAIAGREIYCHSDDKCSNPSIGMVSGASRDYEQCFTYIFGPTGQPPRYKGLSFQWTNGQCYSKRTNGEVYASADKPSLPVDGADLPVLWTGISCYPDEGCGGPRSAVVYNWEDCRRGHYPVWEGPPPSATVNAKSFFWGGTCFKLVLNGKKLTSVKVATKGGTPPDGTAYRKARK